MIDINDFLGIAIVGAALSAIVEFIKNKYGTASWVTKLLTVVLAILVGTGYYFLQGTGLLTTILGVLAAASTVYAYFLK